MAQKICDNYDNLTPLEKSMFMGELVHAAQSCDLHFNMAKELIKSGYDKGLFAGVSFNITNENIDHEKIN